MKHLVFTVGILGASFFAGPASAADLAARVLPAPANLGEGVTRFVSVPAGMIALTHVRVIDGTGASPQEDRTLIIENGKITAIQPAAAAVPARAHVIDLSGSSVLPGLVGMHDHLFYIARPNLLADGSADAPLVVPEMVYSAPRLYLAGGVTTLRTTGSVEPYTDLNLKAQIDAGLLPGPHIDVTAPYLEGKSDLFIQMHQLTGPEDARQMVDYWAAQGATSFKAYMHITRDELGAAVAEAHKLGLKVTGHLCAVTYHEAIALGIDNLEHGFFVNTEGGSRQGARSMYAWRRCRDARENDCGQPGSETADRRSRKPSCRHYVDIAGHGGDSGRPPSLVTTRPCRSISRERRRL